MPLISHHGNKNILEDLERHARQHYPELTRKRRFRQSRRHPSHATSPETRSLRWQDRVLLVVAICLASLLLLRVESAAAAPPDEPWGLQLMAQGQVQPTLALETTVHAEVTGQLARVHVAQTFRNEGSEWAEGVYRFPLPDGAAVDRLFIQVGERVLEGAIQEREAATRIYQKARDEGKLSSLVQQERVNQFTSRLANIPPGEEIHVVIGFLSNVEFDNGIFGLTLPTTFNLRYGHEPQPVSSAPAPVPQLVSTSQVAEHGLTLEIDLLTGVSFSAIESLFHDVEIFAIDGGYRIVLADSSAVTDRDFALHWTPEIDATAQSALSTWSDGQQTYAQLMLVPPADFALQEQPREVIFVIDTSGSMQGASMKQARAALLRGLEALQPADRFNLIQFNSTSEALFRQAKPVRQQALEEARNWIRALEADGGTEMAPALRRALDGSPGNDLMRQVVFITDGSIGNERELLAQIADTLGGSRLFTVGIGSAPNAWFMRKAAEIGRGHFTRIGQLDDVAHQMTSLWARIRQPAITDLCVDWGMEAEMYPEIIPDLYAGQPLWVIARLPAEPHAVRVCGELNGRSWQHDTYPLQSTGNESLATLWARRKIEALQDGLVVGDDPEVVRREVLEVALDYRLLTPHTSLVAVDRTPSRPGEAQLAKGNLPSLLPAGSTFHSAGFPNTATGWKTQLTLSLLVLGISGWLFLRPFSRLPKPRNRSSRRESAL